MNQAPPHAWRAEDWARVGSYVIGAAWSVLFLVFTPSNYSAVIDASLSISWSVASLTGCLVSLIGALSQRDTKVELAGIYIVMVGLFLYLVAQFGFLFTPPPGVKSFDRIALIVYIAWHVSLLLPRLVGLEAYRRSYRRGAVRHETSVD